MPMAAMPARRGLVTSRAMPLPSMVTTLRSATESVEETTLRKSSVSAASRLTSSPARVRAKKSISSRSRCPNTRSRRSATTFSPSRLMQKKRPAVAMASTSATAMRPRNQRSMLPESDAEKPWSIINRTATGKASVALEDSTRKPSQPAIRPRYGRRNGSRVRRAASGRGRGWESAAVSVFKGCLGGFVVGQDAPARASHRAV